MTHTTLPAIPWEERPAGNTNIFWRYSGIPIIPRSLLPSSNSIFNSDIVRLKENFAGVFRCNNKKTRNEYPSRTQRGSWTIAMEQLFSFFDKQFPEDITLLPTELITRRSCGCNT